MFVVCSGCRRHVRAEHRVCPFCGDAGRVQRPEAAGPRRLDRLALFTFAASLAACGSSAPPPNLGSAPAATSHDGAAPANTPSAPPEFDGGLGLDDAEPAYNGTLYGAPPAPSTGPDLAGSGLPGGVPKPKSDGPESSLTWKTLPASGPDLTYLKARTAALRACHAKVLKVDPTYAATCKIELSLGGGVATKAVVTCAPVAADFVTCLTKRLETPSKVEGDARKVSASARFTPLQ
ncbi:MAG: hypothetical protein IPJ34_26825 [Myxococcales bacterium]|nr:hypothetical protein [Myxococcales bacterium]